MKNNPIDQPFKLDRFFFLTYIFCAIPLWFYFKPWAWDLPIYSTVLATIFLPFFSAIFVYTPIAFIIAICKSGKRGKKVFIVFFNTFFLLVLSVVSLLLYENSYSISPFMIGALSLWMTYIVLWKLDE